MGTKTKTGLNQQKQTETQSKMEFFANSLSSAFSTAVITMEPKDQDSYIKVQPQYQGSDRVADFYARLWVSIVTSASYAQSGLTSPVTSGKINGELSELYKGCIKDEHELLKSM